MAATRNYPWHLYMRPPQMLGANAQYPPQVFPPVVPKHLLLPTSELSSGKPSAPALKPVKLNFDSVLDVLNPLKSPKQQRQRSSSTSSESTVEIPRSHPPPSYYYWHPAPSGPTAFTYYATPQPPRPESTTPRSKVPPCLDGHNDSSGSEDGKPAKRKGRETMKDQPILYHYCAKCGRPRSRRYQRENPIKKGIVPPPKICSRCLPPTPQGSTSEDDHPDDKAIRQDPPKKKQSYANEEIEEILIRRGRGRPSFFGGYPPPIESVRVTRRKTSSSPDDNANEGSESSDLSVHYQQIRIGTERDDTGQPRPARIARPPSGEKAVYRYRLVDDETPKSKNAKPLKPKRPQQPPRQEPEQEPQDDSEEKPQPPREPSPPRPRQTVYRYKVVERPKTAEPKSAQSLPKKCTCQSVPEKEASPPAREHSPLYLRVRYVPESDEGGDEPAKHCHKREGQKQPAKPRNAAPPPKSDAAKETYQVVLLDRSESPYSQSDRSDQPSKPREPSPPEWYYRQYRRYNKPIEDPVPSPQPGHGNRIPAGHVTQRRLPSPRRRFPSPKTPFRRLAHAIMPPHAQPAPRNKYRSGDEKHSHHYRYMSESSDDDGDDEGPRSRVRFVAGTKTDGGGAGRGVPCTPSVATVNGERAMQRQREAVEDWEEERHDQHDLNRAKRIVSHKARQGGGAFELDGHLSEGDGCLSEREDGGAMEREGEWRGRGKVMRWDDGMTR